MREDPPPAAEERVMVAVDSPPSTATPPPPPRTGANRRYLKATLAGGAGGVVAVLFFLLEERPELARLLVERVLVAWGPQFILALLLFALVYLLADRYAPRLIAAQNETALALQNLARAVEQIAARDNTFQREQDVLLNHVARRVDSLHRMMESHRRALNGHLRRLGPRPPSASGKKQRHPRSPAANRKAKKSG